MMAGRDEFTSGSITRLELTDFLRDEKARTGFIRIERTLYHHEGQGQRGQDVSSSEWKLNGARKTQREVENVVRGLHIQVDNLCQFLAQDKVVEFARQKPPELLLNTEKVISEDLHTSELQELIERGTSRHELDNTINNLTKQKENLSTAKQNMEPDVDTVKRRKALEGRRSVLEKKEGWCHYEKARTDHEDCAKESKDLQSTLKAEKAKNAPLNAKKERLKAQQKRLTDQIRKLRENGTRVMTDERRAYEQAEQHLRADLRTAQTALDKTTTDKEDHEKMLRDQRGQLEACKKELEKTQSNEDTILPKLKEVEVEIREIDTKLQKLDGDSVVNQQAVHAKNNEVVAIDRLLQRLEDVDAKRERQLRQFNEDAFRAKQWVDGNRHLFKGPVHGPLISILKIKDPKHTIIVENSIAYRDLSMFICEDNDDSLKLMSELREVRKWNVPAAHGDPNDPATAPINIDNAMKKLGFFAPVSELFDAPAAVKIFLNKTSRLHQIPVGSAVTEKNLEQAVQAAKQRGASKLLTDSSVLNFRTSKYSGELSTQTQQLRAPKHQTLDSGEQTEQRNRLRAEREKHDTELKKVGAVLAERCFRAPKHLTLDSGEQTEQRNRLRAEREKHDTELKKVGAVLAERCFRAPKHLTLDSGEQTEQRNRLRAEREKHDTELKKVGAVLAKQKQEVTALNGDLARLKQAKIQLQKNLGRKSEIERKAGILTSRLAKEEKKVFDVDAAKEAHAEKKQLVLRGYVTALQKYTKRTKDLVGIFTEAGERVGENCEVHAQLVELSNQASQTIQALEQLQKETADAETKVKAAKKKVQDMFDELKQLCDVVEGADGKMQIRSPALRKELATCPSELDKIQDELTDVERQIQLIPMCDPNVMQQYERTCRDLDDVSRRLADSEQKRATWQDNMNERISDWIKPLEKKIELISRNFAKFLKTLGCVGEVQLDPAGDNFSHYGVKLLVKFRESESLKELTGQHQSGGERSVATILYMLSLQELSHVPFRCVDEINQGMDPENERRVFEMMVKLLSSSDASAQLSATQYFMLTPKLLPDLKFGRDMNVLFVHNGPKYGDEGVGPDMNFKAILRRQEAAIG